MSISGECAEIVSHDLERNEVHEYAHAMLDVGVRTCDPIRVHSVVAPVEFTAEARTCGLLHDKTEPAAATATASTLVWGKRVNTASAIKLRNSSLRRSSFRRSASAGIRAISHDLVRHFSFQAAAATSAQPQPRGLSKGDNNEEDEEQQQQEEMSGSRRRTGRRTRLPRLERSESAAQLTLRRLSFITNATAGGTAERDRLWKEVETRFNELACPKGLLSRSDFAHCIGMKESKEFAGQLFDALCRRRGKLRVQSITKEELQEYYFELIDETFDNRLQLFFEMFDTNADGRITEDEVKELIVLSASANRLSKLKEQAEEYATLIMEELDPDNIGYVEAWQLESLLLQKVEGSARYNYQSQNLKSSQALSQNLVPTPNPFIRLAHRIKRFVLDNWKRIWILAIWILLMLSLFTWKFIQYKSKMAFKVTGYCVCFAKGAAETLKLNMAIILLPVCRNTITWLRNTKLGALIPFDDNINFHKTVAAGIVVGVVIHGGIHLTCDFPRIVHAPIQTFGLIQDDFHHRRPSYMFFFRNAEGITGVIMVVLMTVAFTLATGWFRRNLVKLPRPFRKVTGFNAFWYTHHLFLVVYACLLIHGTCLFLTHEWYQKTTWMYLCLPAVVYLGERSLRAFRSGYHGVDILKVAIYPGNVLSLHLSKPQGFKYRSGQYMFLKCPEISPFEWHPFSITSAPADHFLSVHIRSVGDWTQELRRLFSESCSPPMGDENELLRADHSSKEHVTREKNVPTVLIDGPYGAPAQHYKEYDVLLLIGLGIGATPFISILKDVLNNLKLAEHHVDLNSHLEKDDTPQRAKEPTINTTHAYFYWVTREQGSFDWFREIMNEIATYYDDHKGVIELHNYLTSVYEEGDARSALITMLQALNYAKNGVDILSETRVRTHLGRPNWRKVFSKMANTHKGVRIGVFYCGAPILAQELRTLAQEYNDKYRTIYGTHFDFHKENF